MLCKNYVFYVIEKIEGYDIYKYKKRQNHIQNLVLKNTGFWVTGQKP